MPLNQKIKSSVFSGKIKPRKKTGNNKISEKNFSVKEDVLDLKKGIKYLTIVVDQLREDFKDFKGEQNDFKKELALVKQKGEATFEEVGKLRIEMVEVKEEITGIKGEISGIKGEITGIKGEISGIKGEITGIKGEIKVINNRLDNIEAELKITNNRLNNIESEIKFIKDEINELKLSLTKKVDIEELGLLERRTVKIEEYIKK